MCGLTLSVSRLFNFRPSALSFFINASRTIAEGMNQGKKNICFYSNQDKWSKVFIEELAKTSWVKEFQFICVDPSPNRPSLPKWLKQVPTLVIEGDKEPVKTDTEVMNWLYERKMREAPKKPTDASASSSAAVISGEPSSYINNEMGGFGDAGYSFLDSDTSTGGNGGESIPGTFSFLNGAASPGDKTGQNLGQSLQTQAGRTKKELMFDQQLDMYNQQRDTGLSKGPARQ